MIFDVTPKRAGFCSLCDKPIREIKQEWTRGAKEGEPRVFGGSLPGAKRITLALHSGANMDWSFCRACHLTPTTVPAVWRRMLAAHVLEISPEWRDAHDLEPYTPEQQERAIESTIGLFVNPPVGILGTRTWEEIDRG